MTKPIPDGYHSVTPSFTFKDSKKAIEFYSKAFSAEVIDIFPNLSGDGIMHATMKIGNSIVMMGDEMPSENCPKSAETLGNCPISLYIYVPDADKFYQQAVAAGGISTMPLNDSFWGDRIAQIRDPFGYYWMIASHTKDLTPEQMKTGAEKFFKEMGNK
jgi:uncharacterized glyoxalase superfamily protein PhnB